MRAARCVAAVIAILALASGGSPARAQPAAAAGPPPVLVGPEAVPPPPAAPPPPTAPSASSLPKEWRPSYTVGAYVEAAYTYGFERPSNGIIEQRGYDDRHNTFAIQNAVIDAQGKLGGLVARVALQVGRTPDGYYLSEPSVRGTASAGAASAATWRFIQQAYAGYRFDVANGLTVDTGVFLSPVGVERMAAKDDWNYSRSNLFFSLPHYHTGARVTLDVTARTRVMMMITNGYDSVIDNNGGKSVTSQIRYEIPDGLVLALLYMGGPERSAGAPEGEPWRHLVDGHVSAKLTSWLELAAQADGGVERNRYGVSWFAAGAAYARIHPASWLYVAGRGDYVTERRPVDARGAEASPMFFPASWMTSGTATLDLRPHDHVSLRVEYRHDRASRELYFAGEVKGDGEKTPYVPNARSQNTVTAAAIAWF